MNKKLKIRKNAFLLILDVFLGAGFVVVNFVQETGIAFHEWFGVFLGLFMLLHIGLHWKWITNMVKKFFKVKNIKQHIKFVVDVLAFTAFFTIIITGILMSRSFLSAFGLAGLHSFTLKMLHAMSTQAAIILIVAHLLLNLKWILTVVKRLFVRKQKEPGKRLLRPEHSYK